MLDEVHFLKSIFVSGFCYLFRNDFRKLQGKHAWVEYAFWAMDTFFLTVSHNLIDRKRGSSNRYDYLHLKLAEP